MASNINGGTINWSVRLSMDRSSLNLIRSDLQKVQQEIDEIGQSGGLTEELEQARQASIDLQNILTNSWNSNLQQLDLSRFNTQIKESYGTVTNLKRSFESAGDSGVRAYNALASSVLSSNLQLKESNKFLDAMSQSLTNAVTWGIASSAFNRIANSAAAAWSYIQRLDTSLNDIRIVTEKSADDMAAFAESANEAAQALGASTVDYSNAALIYYQQGLDDEEAKTRTEVTLKTANVTGQSTTQVSEQLTAVWNGYNVSTEDAEEAVDILAAVAAATAADLEELSTGMSKVASAASTLGVTEQQLASQIATIVSTTREAPETVGSGLKTIYARLSNIQAGTNEDDETTLKSYTEKMANLGFSVLDANNNLRDMGDVIEEVGNAWEDLTREQQISLAQVMAGTWQYNKLLALFDNWDEYVDTMEVANNSTGTLQKQQEIYMDSIAAHLQQLETAAEGVYTTLSDTGFINTLIDGLTLLVDTLDNFLSGLGNVPLMFGAIGAAGAKIFSSQISSGIGKQLKNSATNQRNKENLERVRDVVNADVARTQEETQSGQDSNTTKAYKSQVDRTEKLLKLTEQLNSEEYNRLTNLNTEITQLDLYLAKLKDIADSSDIDATPLEITQQQLQELKDEAAIVKDDFDKLFEGVSFQEIDGEELFKDFNHNFIENWNSIKGTDIVEKLTDEQRQSLQEISNKIMDNAADEEDYNKVLEIRNQLSQKYTDELRAQERLVNQIKPLDGENQADIEARLKELQDQFSDETGILKQQEGLQALIDTASNGFIAFSGFYSVYHSLINEDLSPLEKAIQVFSGLAIAIPALNKAVQSAIKFWRLYNIVIDLARTKLLALRAVMSPMKTLIGVVITAAVIALSYAIYKISEASQAAQKNLERLQEEVEVLTDRFKAATDAADEFKESISEYDDAIDALEELEKGTEEYKEALEEANKKAKELIETYGLWSDYHYESGRIVIDEAALETKEAELEAEAVTAEKLYYSTLIGENSAELQVDLETLGLDEIETYRTGAYSSEKMDVDDWEPILDWLNKETDQGQTYSDAIVQALGQMTDEEIKALTSSAVNSEKTMQKISSFITDTLGLEIDEADGVIDKYLRAILLNIDAINNFNDILNNAGEGNAYYTDQILQAVGSGQYGDQFKEYATNKEGEVDSERVAQLEAAYAGRFKGLTDETGQTFQERIEGIDVSDINRYSELRDYDEYSDITSENDLYLEYLTTALGMSVEAAAEALSAAGGDIYEAKDSEGNTLVSEDISTTDMMQALARIVEVNDIIDEFSGQLTGAEADTYVDALGKLVEQTEQTSDFFGVDFAGAILDGLANGDGKFDLSTILPYLSEEQAAMLGAGEGNQISYEDFMRLFGFDPSDDSQVAAFEEFCKEIGFEGGEAACSGFDAAMDEYDADAFWDNLYSAADKGADAASNLMGNLQSGDVTAENITEDEDYQQLISSLEVLQQQYPNLRDEVELLNSTWLVGTNAYYEALAEVQDLMFGLKIQDMANELQDSIDELYDENGEIDIELLLDSETFDDAMQDIMDQDYQITMEVKTELDNEFDSTISAMENLEEMASKIGDSYIVAASDIAELNNTFPGIIEGYQKLADGTIQLNQQTVQSAVEAAKESVQADIDATKQKLENAKTEYQTKRNAYAAIATAFDAMASGTVDTEDETAQQRAIIEAALTDINNANTALWAGYTDDKNVEIATSSQTNAGIVAMNYQEAWQSASDSAYDAAVNMVSYMKDIDNETSPSAKLTVGINYSGSNGFATEVSEAEEADTGEDTDFKALFNSGNYESGSNAAWEMVAALDTVINGIEGQIAELDARDYEFDYALDDIAAGGSGSGSSGSDSGSEDEPDVEDYLEDELDLYHDINLELEAIDRNLSRLQKRESKLTGQALLENLNAQLETLNDQIDATNRKLEIAKDELSDIRTELSAQGVLFDENGYISNYTEIYESQLAYYNSLVDKYNAMSADAQDEFKDTLEQAEDDFDAFVERMEDYDKLISETIPDLEDEIQDAIDEQIEIQIEKFTASIEIRLDMTEAEQDWNKFYRKIILGIDDDDDIFAGAVQSLADLLSYYNTAATELTGDTAEDWLEQIQAAIGKDGTGLVQSLTQQVTDTLEQLKQIDETGTSSVYGDDYASALEDLQNYNEELMDNLMDIEDLIDEISEAYLDMIDEAIDTFDEQVEQYEYINDLLNHDLEIIDLLYGEDAYAEMSKYYAQIEANNNKQLDFLRQRVDYAYEMMQAETDDEAREKWQEEWEDALSELNDTVESAIENIIDQYSNTINQIISELNDAITDGLGLSYISDEWDLINDKADIYLDTINSVYAVQSLQQKYLDAIDDTDSISAQQKLNAVMEEQLSYLQEKENLTQYDIDRAEKVYELTLAQIALEEAQQNKSTMRLRRDSQGNYSYEFVADENKIAEAYQNLLDLQNELYNFDLEAYQDNLDEIYSMYEEFQEKILELYEDQTLSAEEREEQIALYVEYYGDIINSLVEENSTIQTNLAGSTLASIMDMMNAGMDEMLAAYGINTENFETMTNEQLAAFRLMTEEQLAAFQWMSEEEQDELMNSLIPAWDSGIQHMADTFAGEGGLVEVCKDALDDLNQATEDYQDSLDELEEAAGIDLTSIANGYDNASTYAKALLEDNTDLITSFQDELLAIQDVISAVEDLRDVYNEAAEAAKAAAEEAYGYTQATNSDSASALSNSNSSSNSSSPVSSAISSISSGSSSGGSSGTSGNGKIEKGDVVTYTGSYYYTSLGQKPIGSKYSGVEGGVTIDIVNDNPYGVHIHSTDGKYMDLGWVKPENISGYDTGGYTGEWNDNDSLDGGKIAVLHQKELVLNAADTENLLNAVSVVRDIASLLNNIDSSLFNKLYSYIDGLGAIQAYEPSSDTLEQNVHIEANFPNVTNSNEIENAFNNLVNVASMYANKKVR